MLLLSLNVALFETNNEKLYEFLQNFKPDIACLQEAAEQVDPQVNPVYISRNFIDQATQKLKYSFFSPTLMLKDFHKKDFHQRESFDFDFGGFIKSGNYIKSKFKFASKANVFVGENTNIKVLDWSTWPKGQSKAVQVVDVQLPGGKKLRVLNYHGIWTKEKIGNEETLAACKKIHQLASQVSFPTIICGDFNLFPDTKSISCILS